MDIHVSLGYGVNSLKPSEMWMNINVIPPELRTFERDKAFWTRIDRRDDGDVCWLWMIESQLSQGGYGTAFYGSIHTTAHRIAYMLVKGSIPDGLQVLHTCEVRWDHDPRMGRRCCNPYHLYVGTPQDNMNDMVRNGRWSRATSFADDSNPNSRISADQLPQLFEDAKTMSQRKVAAKYGISKSQVGNILRGESRPSALASMSDSERATILAANIHRTKSRKQEVVK